jgi:NADH-quinone oxidoreductase subunit I
MNLFREVVDASVALVKGYGMTLRHVFRPAITENYPDVLPKFEERYRGIHELQRDENGLEKCVACFLCSAACPANAIYIEAAENTEKEKFSQAERYAKVYNIDYGRCIFCGFCVEACPTDAITHGHKFEFAIYDTKDLIYTKDKLLVPEPRKERGRKTSDQAA